MRTITDKLVFDYKIYLIDEEKSDATVKKYLRDVLTFKRWLKEKNITKSAVLEYKKHLMECYEPVSVNSFIASLNSFFVFSKWYDLKLKTLKIQRQIFAVREKELTKAEYERLLTAALKKNNKRLYLIMQTMCSCGIRVSELEHITVASVKNGMASINSKGKIRRVYLPDDLCKMLKRYVEEKKIHKGSVFVTRSGKPIDRSNIWSDMKKLCKSAGVSHKKVFPHNLRHLFARTYYSVCKDVVRLSDILGHSSVNTTRIYTMEAGDIHRKQIQKLGLLLC